MSITVVIPSVCSTVRAEGLLNAIRSARQAAGTADVQVVVVANGPQVNLDVTEAAQRVGATVLTQAKGSLPLAVALGRSHVRTPFFAFLDDDDELLPGSLQTRLACMLSEPEVALVVSNGYREVEGSLVPMCQSMTGISDRPLMHLLDQNWLASCAGLYRTSIVDLRFFQDPHGFAEWTWLAFKICNAGLKIHTVDAMGYVIHDTPGSLSKSQAYRQSYISLFDRMLACDLEPPVRRRILEKRCAAYHDLSVRSLGEGRLAESATMHLRSLQLPHGLRYFLYGRRILFSALRGR